LQDGHGCDQSRNWKVGGHFDDDAEVGLGAKGIGEASFEANRGHFSAVPKDGVGREQGEGNGLTRCRGGSGAVGGCGSEQRVGLGDQRQGDHEGEEQDEHEVEQWGDTDLGEPFELVVVSGVSHEWDSMGWDEAKPEGAPEKASRPMESRSLMAVGRSGVLVR